jgi:cellulose biosynthesis protein BcsQ
MISPLAVTDTPRPISRLCTSSTNTARQLLCPRQLHLKDHHSLKWVVEVAEVAEVAKAKVASLLIRNIGRTKHSSTAVRRNTCHLAA